MSDFKIFYYWQSGGNLKMPPYMELCVETWRIACPGVEIIRINLENLQQFSSSRFDLRLLSRLPYPIQSDFAAAAIMQGNNGLFLDADTILLRGFRLDNYSKDRVSIYGGSLVEGNHSTAFLSSFSRGNHFLDLWVQEAIRRMKANNNSISSMKYWFRMLLKGKHLKVPWNYLGNGIIDDLLRMPEMSDFVDLRSSQSSGAYIIGNESTKDASPESYNAFWLSESTPIAEVLSRAAEKVLFLLNSWLPKSYREKSYSDILEDRGLISRTLQHALGH